MRANRGERKLSITTANINQDDQATTPLCVGFGEACFLAVRERERDEEQAAVLAGSFLEQLDKAGVTYAVNGSREERVAQNLNLRFEGIEAKALLAQLPTPAISTDSRVFVGLHWPIRRVDSDGSGGRPGLEPGANRLREGNRAG